MQDTTTDFAPASENDMAQSRNLAAIALAEAINRARQQQGALPALAQDGKPSALMQITRLRRKLAPLYAAIPQDVELFDLGFVTEEKPRLFVDIIAFVEMSADLSQYRFVQETRSGRSVILETDDETLLIAKITDHIARRLIDREKAMETDAKAVAVASERSVTAPDLPHARPESSMTAAEAFRQWSAAGKRALPATMASVSLPPVPSVAAAGTTAALAIKQDTQNASPVVDSTKTAIESAATSISEAAQAIRSREVAPAAPTAAAVATTASPAVVAAVSRSNAWWLWPLIALLLGIGLGIAALYAYAASLTR